MGEMFHVKRKLKVRLKREKAQTNSQLIQLTSSPVVFHKWLWYMFITAPDLPSGLSNWASGNIIFCQVDTYVWVLLESGHLIQVAPFLITASAVGGSSMQLLGAASVVVSGNCAYVASILHLANCMVHNWYHHRHERQSERHSQLHPQITSQMSENKLEAPRAEHLCAPFLN